MHFNAQTFKIGLFMQFIKGETNTYFVLCSYNIC